MKRTLSFRTPGAFGQVVAVTAICPDGKVRKVRVGSPDTMFSMQGRTNIGGLAVNGTVTTADHYMFVPVEDVTPEMTRSFPDHGPHADGTVMVNNPDDGEYVFHVSPDSKHYGPLMARCWTPARARLEARKWVHEVHMNRLPIQRTLRHLTDLHNADKLGLNDYTVLFECVQGYEQEGWSYTEHPYWASLRRAGVAA